MAESAEPVVPVNEEPAPASAPESNTSEKRKLDDTGDASDEPAAKKQNTEPVTEPNTEPSEQPAPAERASRFSDTPPPAQPTPEPGANNSSEIAAAAAAAAVAAVAALQGASAPDAGGLGGAPAGGFESIVIACPQNMVGKIIGRSGATVQGLQDQTGAKIQID